MAINVEEARAKLLEAVPKQVTFVAIERYDHNATCWCYYTVVGDLEQPRWYQWRRAEIDYERLFGTEDVSFFWDTQPRTFHLLDNSEPDSARLWVERQFGRWETMDELLRHFELWAEFATYQSECFGWDKNVGVFTMLPKEIEDRSRLAQEFLEDRLVRRKDA